MKKIILTLFAFLLIVTSCHDNSGGGGITNPFGTGPGGTTGTGNVTFTISSQKGQQGIIFLATPSVSVKLTKVTVSLPAQNYNDVIQGDGTTVYNANQAVPIDEYIGVASGQQWTFQFEGTIANNNQAYNVTSYYTVP